MKKFKNNFGVKGSSPLLKALKEEVEKLGWKYDNDFNPWCKATDLYFNANRTDGNMKTQHFSSSSVCNCTIYTLPQQWDECLKAASELEEEIPEYIEFINDGFTHFTKGTIYPLNKEGRCQCNTGDYPRTMQYPKDKEYMKPSTKEAYEKQQEEFKLKELLKEAKKRYAEIIKPKKEIKPWTIGTYVVFLKEYGGNPKGTISNIVRTIEHAIETEATLFQTDDTCCLFKDKECKWFPTLQEAEAFSKELLKEEESMEIAGYSVKFKDDKVSIGCYKDITLKDLKTMRKAIKVASKFGEDLTVTEDSIIDNTEGSAIFLDEIEELIERLNG